MVVPAHNIDGRSSAVPEGQVVLSWRFTPFGMQAIERIAPVRNPRYLILCQLLI